MPQNDIPNDIEMEEKDPWNVQSLYEMQYFNCPGCIYKSKAKQDFVTHIYENHAEAILTLRNIKDDSLRDKSSMK